MKLYSLRRNPLLGIAVGLWVMVWLIAGSAQAQVTTGTIAGAVKDASGALVPNATVTVKQQETGLTRTAVTDAAGNYTVAAIPIGHYDVSAEAPGFKKVIHSGVELAVAQTAVINLTLEVGAVQQEVTVTGEAPVVNTTTSPTEGEVAPKQVADLPLNGRNFNDLLVLFTGTNNFSENDATPSFSIGGHRGEYNRFILNGVDLIGTDSSSHDPLPEGSSGGQLGVDAIQEFNVETNDYGAELGKRAGGQINIVTTSGTNNFHGDLFEFLRNTDANANSFFYTPASATTQNRNQFGGAIGGPIIKDKVFFFASYEGVRQSTRTGSTSTIPDANALNGLLPNGTPISGVNPGMLPLVQSAYPNPATYPGGCKEIAVSAGQPGECTVVGAPLVTVREDFGLTRVDYNLSSKDTLATTYLYDNGVTGTGTLLPVAAKIAPIGYSLLSMQETHIFSPELLNVATFGFNRSYASSVESPYLNSPIAPSPIPSYDYFVTNSALPEIGAITVNGGVAAGLGATTGTEFASRNYFTWADDMHYTKGMHDITFGVWLQRLQSNNLGNGVDIMGAPTFSNITSLLQGTALDFYVLPDPTELGFRSTEYAGYLQDNIKLRHNLNVRLGLRIEGDNGWNEPNGLSDNYSFGPDAVLNTQPVIGDSPFIQNKSVFLPEPRVGLAWDPFGNGKTSVRAGFGIYDDLVEPDNNRMGVNAPENERITDTNVSLLSVEPINAKAPLEPLCSAPIITAAISSACIVPEFGGVDNVAQTPTTMQWNFSIEQQLTRNLVFHVEYDGFEAYHTEITADPNEPFSAVCNNPAGCASGGVNTNVVGAPTGTVPQGTAYFPLSVNPATGAADGCRPNCDLADGDMYFFSGTSNYNALTAFLQQRFSNGIAFRANYTWEKVLGYGSGAVGSQNSNAPMDLEDFWNPSYSYGPLAYNVPQQFTFEFDAALPFGKGHPWANNLNPVEDAVIGGWQFNGIFTAQSGYPFTPLLNVDWDGSGAKYLEDMPNVVSGCSVINPGINVTHYYNSSCFSVPFIGSFGDESVGEFQAPGLTNLDFSLFKKFTIRETKSLELRIEAFNLLNHPNFGIPNQDAFTTTSGSTTTLVNSATYGQISAINGNMRQLQFGLKFIF